MTAEKKRKMSVPVSVINEVKVWLNSHNVRVSLDWVEACVEFLNQEFQIPVESGSLQRLKNSVYEQWLSADLEEIGVQCLPPDLSAAQKTTLHGSYALQINGIRDIGKSAYSQLKQLDGAANENAEVSATPKPSMPEWEAKPTRMLMMNLTDGINCVQGMEYKPTPCLSVDLPVGVKVVIQGPIDCRFGVLLLTAEKIRVLGGGVEALVERYSKEAVLREVLQLQNESDGATIQNGHAENPQFAGPRSENNVSQNMRSTPVQHPVRPQTSNATYHSSANPGSSSVPLSHPQENNGRTNCNLEGFTDIENIDFDNFGNEDDDAFISSIDYDALEKIEKESFSSALPKNDDFDVSEDEEVYQEIMALQENVDAKKSTKALPEQSKMSSSAFNKLTSPNLFLPSVKVQKSDQNHSSSVNQMYTPTTSRVEKWMPSSNESTSHATRISSSSVMPPKSSSSPSVIPQKSSPSASGFSPSVNQKMSFTSSVSSSFNKQSVPTSSEYISSNSSASSSTRLSKSSTSESSVSLKTSFTPSIVSSINKQSVPVSSAVSSANSPTPTRSSASVSTSINQQTSSPGSAEDKPYSNLASVLQNKNSSSEFTVIIKARIGTTLSRLECSSTSGWQLTVKLHDGTETVEAMFHDKVLEEFIGIPAKDMVSLQTQARSNVEIKNKIMVAVTNCKKKLRSLNCPMEIKFSPQLPKPCVIKCFL